MVQPSRTEFWWFHQVAAGLCPICTAACVLQYRISCSSMCDLFICYVCCSEATKIAKTVWSQQLYLVIWEFVIWVQHQIWTFTFFNHSRLKVLKCDSNIFFGGFSTSHLGFSERMPKKINITPNKLLPVVALRTLAIYWTKQSPLGCRNQEPKKGTYLAHIFWLILELPSCCAAALKLMP